jgi:hypothetical protein
MMRVALTCSKDATTPEAQLSLQGNKPAQNEAEPESSRRSVARIWDFKAYASDSGA